MAGEHIFIVEDEKIVAEDLKRMLERLGYVIKGSASTGETAIEQIQTTRPDLVLMDIRIRGPMDGIDVAEHVAAEHDIPVVYLTAYADEITLDRAKGTMASGYILKPFEERTLKTTIELALYRHRSDQMMKNIGEWHGGILENLSAAVMATDLQGHITYVNKTAETMIGQDMVKVMGKPLEDVLPSRQVPVDCDKSPIQDKEGTVVGTAYVFRSM